MIVAAPHILLSLRWVPPGVAILGSAPIFLAHWTAIKILTFPLPYRFYRRLDEYLYGKYQAMVGFYYETWSGVEVPALLMHLPHNGNPAPPDLQSPQLHVSGPARAVAACKGAGGGGSGT